MIDLNGKTLISASTKGGELSKEKGTKIELSQKVGGEIAKKALDAGIKTVVFDRNGYLYHGRVKALAEAARKSGLKF